LLGLAVGDALGTTYEFDVLDQPGYPTLATGPATDVVGGGPFGLVAGQVTDDTQMAVALACSLRERGGLDVTDVARRYVAWSDHAFDIGNQTRGAIDLLEAGEPGSSAGLTLWRERERRPAGNGSLMRTAPIGVVYARRERTALIDAAIADSLITHADPRCALACAAFDAAIASAITGDGAMLDVATDALSMAAARLRAAWSGNATEVDLVDDAARELAGDLAAASARDPGVYGQLHVHRTAGFVRVAFRLAFWHAAHTPSWRDAVVDVASRGGDADTNAAITGALLGARDGSDAIPAAWVERVLAVTQPGPREWADAHHPRHLIAE
jgi:ADP-ribosyl-[dinitrogen reductase] hydrolase